MANQEVPFYNPNEIEAKWQKKWADDRLYESNIDDIKTQVLCPYHAALSFR